MIHREISDKKFQMDSLDGLRGFAALIVVFSHTSNSGMYFAPFFDMRGIGKSGVFLFFLLSSFLLALPLLSKGKQILTFSVMSHYWQRRFFRIYPLYTLYLLLAITTTWIIATFLGRDDVGIPFRLDWLGFFKHITLQEGKGLTWSIVVEFKFYFILPVLALTIVYIRSYGLLVLLLSFITLLSISQTLFPQSASVTNDARLLPYMPIFLIGIFLAVIQSDTNHKKSYTEHLQKAYKYLGYVGVIGIALMIPAVFSMLGDSVPEDHFHKQFILYATLWSFVLLSAVNVPGVIQRFFTLPILRFYGTISFSLYLFHIIFILALKVFDLNPYLSAWVVLIASTVTAYISFMLLERPVSQFKITKGAIFSAFAYIKRLK